MKKNNNQNAHEVPEYDERELVHGQIATIPKDVQEQFYTQELEAFYGVVDEDICLFDREGRVLRMGAAMQDLLCIGPALDVRALSLKERAIHFFIRAEDGTSLVEEELPVRRILNGELLKHTNSVDVLVRRADGHDLLVNVCGAPIRDQDGKICGALTLCCDVTGRRQMALHTRQALDALLTVAEALVQEEGEKEEEGPVGESVIGRLLELPSRLFACERVGIVLLDPETEVLHPMVVVGISPEYAQHWRNSLEGVRLGEFLEDSLLVLRLRTGEIISLDISLSIQRDQPSYRLIAPILKGNELTGMLLLGYGDVRPRPTSNEIAIIKAIARFAGVVIERAKAQDERDEALTALRSANEELARMNKLKNDLISTVSHEFHTALTSIQGFSELIRDRNLKIVEMKEFAGDIHSDAIRLTRRINDLVDLDLKESRRSQLQLGWVDLNEVILDVVMQVRKRAPEHTFRTHLARVLPMLVGDRDKLVRVVFNYLNNAVWYSPAGGEIVVSSVVEGNLVHVAVLDHGVGIAPNELELIFERYAQIERPDTLQGYDEVEVDLPLVREIVEQHGGQVWVESIPGKGSAFHFTVQFTSSASKGEYNGKDRPM